MRWPLITFFSVYYACSVTSTWKPVMHTKLNRFNAETYTRDREKMQIENIVIENIILFFSFILFYSSH